MACVRTCHDDGGSKAAVGAIVVYTNAVSFYAFGADDAHVLNSHRVPVANEVTSSDGHAEQDPVALLDAVRECVCRTVAAGQVADHGARVVAVGLANHRGSVVAWDRRTGAALCNVLLWSDNRTAAATDEHARDAGAYRYQRSCGLPFGTCFSASKIRWLIDFDPCVNKAYRNGDCYFGTVDTWLLWNLTGGVKDGVFATDTTNAANTFLMNINTLEWDAELLEFFGIALHCLPTIRRSAEVYGSFADGPLMGTPISAVMGNRQAALVGHKCFERGATKVTLDSDGSVLRVTGTKKIFSRNGLTTTIAYHLDKCPVYALEGHIASAGRAIEWTKKHFNVTESECRKDDDGHYVYFVPAFNGLYAPHWRPMTCCALFGMNKYTCQRSILSGAVDSVGFQSRDILEAMRSDAMASREQLMVDGCLSWNRTVMQSLSDITDTRVVVAAKNHVAELGVAMAAGHAAGVNVWNALRMPEPDALWPGVLYLPEMTADERAAKIGGWKKALSFYDDYGPLTRQPVRCSLSNVSVVVGLVLLGIYFVYKKM